MTDTEFYREHERLLTEINALTPGGLVNRPIWGKEVRPTKKDMANDGRKFLAEMMETRLKYLRDRLAPLQAAAAKARRAAEMHASLAKEQEEEERQRRHAEALAELQAEQDRQDRLAAARAELAAK